jgi:hypothetical protein
MRSTRVLFSFGSTDGGLDFAKRLRAELLVAGADSGAAESVHLRPAVTDDG